MRIAALKCTRGLIRPPRRLKGTVKELTYERTEPSTAWRSVPAIPDMVGSARFETGPRV
ncbi:hypothetical protein SPHINGOAX6_50442 [Sphingomonas sp. AX6]|nr:hypothetical protein SPHINGOAX6_50442 [Sphingomonas sp. AX6]